MLDENTMPPEASPDSPPATPDAPASPSPLTFTPEQLDALGLKDCEPDQSYSLEIKCTSTDPESGEMTFEAAGPAEPSEGDEPTIPGAIPGNDEAPDETPLTESDDSGKPSVLGYARDKKAPRAGLPDTKKMRNI